jgi:hypothetical protein
MICLIPLNYIKIYKNICIFVVVVVVVLAVLVAVIVLAAVCHHCS